MTDYIEALAADVEAGRAYLRWRRAGQQGAPPSPWRGSGSASAGTLDRLDWYVRGLRGQHDAWLAERAALIDALRRAEQTLARPHDCELECALCSLRVDLRAVGGTP